MVFLFLTLLTGAFFVGLIKKYVFGIKEPNVEDFWHELDKEEWYKALLINQEMKEFINLSKRSGLLSDPNYVRNILDKEGHREGFIKYLIEKTKLN